MIYFDTEKGEYVWLRVEPGRIVANDLKTSLITKSYCFLSISEAKHPEKEIEIITETCKKNNISFVLLPASVPNNTEEHLRWALNYLNSEEAKNEGYAIKEGYDYAWIKRVIDKKLFIGASKVYNKSYTSFISYIKSFKLKIHDVASSTVLSRYYKLAEDCDENGRLPWDYVDCVNDRNEKTRRNRIASTFLEIMSEYGR